MSAKQTPKHHTEVQRKAAADVIKLWKEVGRESDIAQLDLEALIRG